MFKVNDQTFNSIKELKYYWNDLLSDKDRKESVNDGELILLKNKAGVYYLQAVNLKKECCIFFVTNENYKLLKRCYKPKNF